MQSRYTIHNRTSPAR